MNAAMDLGELAVRLGMATPWQVSNARAEQSRRQREEGRRAFLAEVLVDRHVIDADQLLALLERGRGYREITRGEDTGALFGDVAVRKGYVSPVQLYLALQEQRDEDAGQNLHRRVGEVLLDRGWLAPWELEDILLTLADLASGSARSGETPSEAIPIGRDAYGGSLFQARRTPRTSVASEQEQQVSSPTLVRDIMAPLVVTQAESPLGEALDKAYDAEADVLLVEKGGEYVGCFNVWDHCQADRDASVESVVSSELATVGETTPADEAVKILGDEGYPCVAVTKRGELVGVVTRRDLKRSGMRSTALDEAVPFEEMGAGD